MDEDSRNTPSERPRQAEADLARAIQRARLERGISLRELSVRLMANGNPLSLSVLSRIETLDRRITMNDASAIAKALDVELVELISRSVELANKAKLKIESPSSVVKEAFLEGYYSMEAIAEVAAARARRALEGTALPDTQSTTKYPWQEKWSQEPYISARGVLESLTWAQRAAPGTARRAAHAKTALVELDALMEWLDGEHCADMRAELKRMTAE